MYHRTVCVVLVLAAAIAGYALGRISKESESSRRSSGASHEPMPIPRGLTWGKVSHDKFLGTDLVSCHAQPSPAGGDCNPHQGDTACEERRPILCIKVDGEPRPPYEIVGREHARPREYYQGWAGGRIGLSEEVAGTQLHSLAAANERCEAALGKGYRMAEHHDGKYVAGMDADKFYGETWPPANELSSGGWAFHAYGDIPKNTRFWVHIDDQRANCWEQAKKAQPVFERSSSRLRNRAQSMSDIPPP